MDIKEIITAWKLKINPPENFAKLAEKRCEICNECEHLKEMIKGKQWSYVCGKCGCPIAGKTYYTKQRACPIDKWKEIDEEYFNKVTKQTKTLI